MSPDRHLVIFAKAPRLGRVKSRLARDIGTVQAWQFYRHNLMRVIRRMSGDERWTTWLAITPDRAALTLEHDRKVLRIDQGTGDLGARMDRVMTVLPLGPVVVIGTDIPSIQCADINGAFQQLGPHDAVMGPAKDGGYCLVGLKRTPRVPHIFDHVRWSSPHALADTEANILKQNLSVHMLRELEDVDDAASYERWRAS